MQEAEYEIVRLTTENTSLNTDLDSIRSELKESIDKLEKNRVRMEQMKFFLNTNLKRRPVLQHRMTRYSC